MTPYQTMVQRTQVYCKQIAVRENFRIRLAKMLGTPQEHDLRSQLSFAEAQVRRLRETPGLFPLPDPMEQNASHAPCEKELETLRMENMQLRVKQDALWAMNADLKFELSKFRKTKRDPKPVKKHPGGRPTFDRATKVSLTAKIRERVGVQGVAYDYMRGTVNISRPALDKLAVMLQDLDRREQRDANAIFQESA